MPARAIAQEHLYFLIQKRGGERMRAAYDTKLGAARDVLHIGEVDTPSPARRCSLVLVLAPWGTTP